MKKLLALMLAVVFCLSALAACGPTNAPADTGDATDTTATGEDPALAYGARGGSVFCYGLLCVSRTEAASAENAVLPDVFLPALIFLVIVLILLFHFSS